MCIPAYVGAALAAHLFRAPAIAVFEEYKSGAFHGREEAAEVETSSDAAQAVEGISLDRFMAKHTSEDNASFNEIIEESNKRRHLQKPWLFEDKNQARARAVVLRNN